MYITRERTEKKGTEEGDLILYNAHRQLLLAFNISLILIFIEQEAASYSAGGSVEDERCRSDAEGNRGY